MGDESALVPVFIPSLSALLVAAEDKKGSPLTEAEATAIRDSAAVIMMERQDAVKMAEHRGYRDIDPENLWHEWQKLRDGLGRKPSIDGGPVMNQVKRGDVDFESAAAHARRTLNEFRELIKIVHKTPARAMFKTRLNDGANTALMWLADAQEFEAGFEGKLFEVPSHWHTWKVGDVVRVGADAVADWMVIDQGRLFGGFSIRVARQRKPEAEWAEFDEYIGVKSYEPLPESKPSA